MRISNKLYVLAQFALCFAIVLAVVAGGVKPVEASDLPANGGYAKVGLGYSPYASTSRDLTEISSISSGLAPSLVLGVVWSQRHSLDVRWQTVYMSGSGAGSQGFLAVTYTQYLKKRGPAPFFDIGFGLQHGPLVSGNNVGVQFETNDGIGFTVGAGLRFSRRLEVAADFAVGSTGRFFSANNTFDFTHQHLAFSVRYTVFGG